VDDRSETLNYRIREAETQKVPYMAVIGQREVEADSMAIRIRGTGKKQDVVRVDEFIVRIAEQVRSHALEL
jgi:threonyl-tRNA synthetase